MTTWTSEGNYTVTDLDTSFDTILAEARDRSAAYRDHDSELYLAGMDALGENVDRGVVFLDSVDPEWYKKVMLRNLDMSDGRQCICGWVFKEMMNDGYQFFVNEYAGDDENERGADYGFMYDMNTDPYIPSDYQWSMLAELWTMKIEKRLANDGLLG